MAVHSDESSVARTCWKWSSAADRVVAYAAGGLSPQEQRHGKERQRKGKRRRGLVKEQPVRFRDRITGASATFMERWPARRSETRVGGLDDDTKAARLNSL